MLVKTLPLPPANRAAEPTPKSLQMLAAPGTIPGDAVGISKAGLTLEEAQSRQPREDCPRDRIVHFCLDGFHNFFLLFLLFCQDRFFPPLSLSFPFPLDRLCCSQALPRRFKSTVLLKDTTRKPRA